MPDQGQKGWREKTARNVRQIGPVRLIGTLLFLLLGLYVARFSWDIPLVSDAERALYDYRFVETAERTLEQDPRIVLITFDDQTLEQLGKRSPLDRGMLARALRAIDRLAPRAIGIDIVIDQRQPEDPELIDTFRRMRTPTFLAFASSNPEYGNPEQMEYWQEQFLRGFLAQVSAGPVRPTSIKTEPDLADGVIRRWGGQHPRLPPLLANALSPVNPQFDHYRGSIDFRLSGSSEVGRFANLPIQLFSGLEDESLDPQSRAALEAGFAETIRDRIVLIGGDIKDVDDYETPMTRFGDGWMKGL
ncbi:MAG: CHASE2 domain-containing protein, partial [Allosphingosinicella sp.]